MEPGEREPEPRRLRESSTNSSPSESSSGLVSFVGGGGGGYVLVEGLVVESRFVLGMYLG